MATTYEEFLKEYLTEELTDYSLETIAQVAQAYLVDQGFGKANAEAAVLFVTNGGRGVDFSG